MTSTCTFCRLTPSHMALTGIGWVGSAKTRLRCQIHRCEMVGGETLHTHSPTFYLLRSTYVLPTVLVHTVPSRPRTPHSLSLLLVPPPCPSSLSLFLSRLRSLHDRFSLTRIYLVYRHSPPLPPYAWAPSRLRIIPKALPQPGTPANASQEEPERKREVSIHHAW
jgi:hypothetical protein